MRLRFGSGIRFRFGWLHCIAACSPRATDSLVVRFGLLAAAPDNTILGEPPVAGIAAATARGSALVGNALKRTGSHGAGLSVSLSSGASVGNSCTSRDTSFRVRSE